LILVAGEALIDLFVGAPVGATMPAEAIAGGSPFNVAVGLARLGAEAGYLGGLSGDPLGTFLYERLRMEGVDLGLAKRSARPTPVALVAAAPDGQPFYIFHLHDCAHQDLLPSDIPASLDARIAALAFGSFALAVEPVGSTLLTIAEREAGRRLISIDLNLRASVVGDLRRWRERIERFARTAAIVKLSSEDLHGAFGDGADAGALAERWLRQGVLLVIVTDGVGGATAFHRGGVLHRPSRPVVVADTVGAGDTFHSALLARLAQTGRLHRDGVAALDKAELCDLLDYATVAASITCTRRGADLPMRAEVDAARSALRV
jgi:fructokinase